MVSVLRPALRVTALGLLCAAGPGCALGTGLAEMMGVRWNDASRTTVTPLGDPRHRIEVDATARASVRFACRVDSRHDHEQVSEEGWTYNAVHRIVMGIFAVGEAAAAAVALAVGVDGTPFSTTSLAVGIPIGVDALATAIIALAVREGHVIVEYPREGSWSPTRGCPAGTTVTYGDRALPVDAGGRLQPDDEVWLITQLVERGGELRVRVADQSEGLWPTQAQRCIWARRLSSPLAESLCPQHSLPSSGAEGAAGDRWSRFTLETVGELELRTEAPAPRAR